VEPGNSTNDLANNRHFSRNGAVGIYPPQEDTAALVG